MGQTTVKSGHRWYLSTETAEESAHVADKQRRTEELALLPTARADVIGSRGYTVQSQISFDEPVPAGPPEGRGTSTPVIMIVSVCGGRCRTPAVKDAA